MGRILCATAFALLTFAGSSSLGASEELQPLLHLDVQSQDGRVIPVSVVRTIDGKEVKRFPGVVGASLSPSGDEIAFVDESLNLVSLDDASRKTIKARDLKIRGERFFPSCPSWSPDGKRIAAITVVLGRTVGDNQWAVAVFDTKSGTQSSRHPVPLATAAGCPFCMAAVNKFRWSPDGARILLSWGNTIIIDVEASRANVVSDTWSSAEWGDGGNVVYLLEVGRQPGVMQLKGFYAIDPASGKRELLLAADSLTDSEITHSAFVHVPLLNSTYDGKQLVINSDVEGDGTMLRFYDLSKQDPPDLRKPDKTTKVAETMPQVVWSPSGRSLAAIAASDWKVFKLMKFDLTKDEWSVIAKLALGDDTHPEAFALKVLSWAQ